MTNLETLALAEISMDHKQKQEFENYFIGALSVTVKKEDWGTALVTAARLLDSHIKRVAERPTLNVEIELPQPPEAA